MLQRNVEFGVWSPFARTAHADIWCRRDASDHARAKRARPGLKTS
jgi:hypothetical protein